jgi:hypothetical protein
VAGCCEHGNKPTDSVKGGEFFDELSDSFSRTLLHEGSSGVLNTGTTVPFTRSASVRACLCVV